MLKEKIEKLELVLGEELHCNSGYRCPKHNKKIGGAPQSTHTKEMAADVKAKGATPHQIFTLAETVGFGGIHAYKTFTHVDVGPNRRW